MKLSKSLHRIWIRKDALQGKNSILFSGETRIRTILKPEWIHGIPDTQGVFIEYKAVKTFRTKKK